MRTELFLLTLALAGCASAPPVPAPPKQAVAPVDEQCLVVAKYARAIAHLRETGVPVTEIGAYTSVPAVMTFPMQYIQYDVYRRPAEGVETFAPRYYQMCVDTGYSNLLVTLRKAERERQDIEDAARERAIELRLTEKLAQQQRAQHTPSQGVLEVKPRRSTGTQRSSK